MLLKLGIPVRCLPHHLNKSLSTQAANLKLDTLDSADFAKARSYSEIPGPTKYELIRGFLPGGKYHKKSLMDYVLNARAQYGELYRIPGLFGKKDIVLAFDVEDIQKVYRTEGVWPTRPGMDSLAHYKNNFLDGHSIREIRDSSSFEVPGNFIEEINRLTFESVAVVALNKQLGLIRMDRDRAESKKLFSNFQLFLRLMYDLDFQPSIWKYVWTPSYGQFKKALDVIYSTITSYINEAIVRYENQPNRDDSELSVLEKLIKIDKSIAIVMAVEMLLAGVDTTSSILSGILLKIATHPEKHAILREEIRRALPQKNSTFTVDSMKNLPYLRACIKEGIRLNPIGPGILRETGEDIALKGYQIPKSSRVMICINLPFREDKYFPKAAEFIPERWIRDGPLENPVTPFSFLPFGFGPRMCAGRRIVDLELEITLARLVRNFYIEFSYPTDNAFKSYLINSPAIPLKFKFAEVEN